MCLTLLEPYQQRQTIKAAKVLQALEILFMAILFEEVPRRGFEPLTKSLKGSCSTGLSYRGMGFQIALDMA